MDEKWPSPQYASSAVNSKFLIGTCWWQVWNLEGMQAGSPPSLLRSFKPFAANQKMPEADITCIAVHEASWPRLTVALGLATSQIYVLRGGSGTFRSSHLHCHSTDLATQLFASLTPLQHDAGKEKLQRSVLHMREGTAGEELVGLAFRGAIALLGVRTMQAYLVALVCKLIT